MRIRSILLFTALAGSMVHSATAWAQSDADRIRTLEERLAAQDARIAALEQLLVTAQAVTTRPVGTGGVDAVPSAPLPAIAQASAVSSVSPLDVSGDLRLRQEFNWSDADGRDRSRSVLRARLRASYPVNQVITVGGQITTGDPGDPNTTDLTLSDFVNDFTVSLDQAYARIKFGDLTLSGGKFANPFKRTDLVWDGDVNPQGFAASYSKVIGGGARVDARALYFILNEVVAGTGSDMLGGQLAVNVPFGAWGFELAGGYYDYRLRSVAGADAGDFRSNLLRPDGRYLSDFNLGDAIATLSYRGLGEAWPISLTAEYVHNFGATDAADGYSIDLYAGRASKRGDWRVGYNFAVAQNEAVLAAFSHDNLGIATNYRLHALSLDHVLLSDTILNLTLYHYRPEDPLYAGANQPGDWLNRVRVNLLFNF